MTRPAAIASMARIDHTEGSWSSSNPPAADIFHLLPFSPFLFRNIPRARFAQFFGYDRVIAHGSPVGAGPRGADVPRTHGAGPTRPACWTCRRRWMRIA